MDLDLAKSVWGVLSISFGLGEESFLPLQKIPYSNQIPVNYSIPLKLALTFGIHFRSNIAILFLLYGQIKANEVE